MQAGNAFCSRGHRRRSSRQCQRRALARVKGTSSSDSRATQWALPLAHTPILDGDRRHDAVVEGLEIHVGLVGLDDADGDALVDVVALGGGPEDDLALRHGGAECRHEDLPDLGAHHHPPTLRLPVVRARRHCRGVEAHGAGWRRRARGVTGPSPLERSMAGG